MRNSAGRAWIRRTGAAAGLLLGAGIVYAAIQGYTALRVASGFISHTLCSQTFVAGFDPDAVYAESLQPMGMIATLAPLISYRVDRAAGTVTTSIGGLARSRSVTRGHAGCLLVHGEPPSVRAEPAPRLPPAPAPNAAIDAPLHAALEAALDRAFAETPAPPHRYTKAIVIVHAGRLLAERYAPGVSAATPLLGYSVTKTVVHALIGILVRDRRLDPDAPAPVAEWAAGDPRHAITVDQLLRMTSGLDLDETHSGLDPSSRILFVERDMGIAAASARLIATPGQRYSYSSGGYLLLSRLVREAAGGTEDALRAFAERELFAPLGMASAVLETDAVGTPVGSTFVLATARDWARFGELYLHDGVVDGRRILPEGWVARATQPTLDTDYGAGVWTNRQARRMRGGGSRSSLPGAPADAFSARGLLGQYVVVVPSQQLVVARFGASLTPGGDSETVGRLVAEVIAALAAAP
jgi:CubicO group peptidase (beta-lactamase class C family)